MNSNYKHTTNHAETSDPSSANYLKNTNNKEHEKSPYCTDEPSTKTDFK